MKKTLLVFVSVTAFTTINAQNSISATMQGTFVQGISPVNNDFSYDDGTGAGTYTAGLQFEAVDGSGNVIPLTLDTSPTGTTYSCPNVDMGQFDAGSYIRVIDVATGDSLEGTNNPADPIPLDFISKPAWLKPPYNGSCGIPSVDYNSGVISMQGQLPLDNFLTLNKNVSGIIGIGGKAFGLTSPNLTFNIEFNTSDGSSTTSQTKLSSDFSSLCSSTIGISNTTFNSTIELDSQTFDLIFNGKGIWEPSPITKGYEFKNIPLAGVDAGIASLGTLCVNTSLEFSLQPKIKAQIYTGYDATAQQWGYLENGADVTQLLAKVTAEATAKGELKSVCGSALGFNFGIGTIARGQVTASLTIGGGIQYYDISNGTVGANTKTLWGGDFNIHAEGEVYGFDSKSGDYNKHWGDTAATNFRSSSSGSDFFKSETFRTQSPATPNAWTMGEISTSDSILAAAWIDNLNFNPPALLVSYYSPTLNMFSTPVIVAQNDSGIVNHSISLLPNKDIIITWTQLSKSVDEILSLPLDDISKSQDIMIAIVDPDSNNVVYKNRLLDNSGDRADGEPRIHWGTGNQGMITWRVGDETNKGSDIYYAVLNESAGTYTLDNPQILNNSVDNNYNVTISYTNGNNAIAAWLNDPDDPDTDADIPNTSIYYSIWNGSNWVGSPQERFSSAQSGIDIKEYTLATNGNYGVEGLTYEYYTSDSILMSGVYLGQWTDGNPDGSTYLVKSEEDSTNVFQLPRVSLSKSGIASLTLQIRDITDPLDEGRINLFMKDLKSTVNWQDVAETNPSYLDFLSNPNQFVWDMSSEYGYLESANSTDIMYLFTQEMDNTGNTNTNGYGEIFGNPNLNLVLRAFQVNNNAGVLTLSDVPEPNSGNVTGFYQDYKTFNFQYSLKQNFPNPFTVETVIPFHTNKNGRVQIELFDMNGRSLGIILNEELIAGDYQTIFHSGILESGIYFYRFTLNGESSMQKMIIAK